MVKKRTPQKKKMNHLIATQNKAIRVNYIKAKIDNTQQNSKCRLCLNTDETVDHLRKCRKLEQKEYKTRHNWVEKEIDWELCKRSKFDHTGHWPNRCSVRLWPGRLWPWSSHTKDSKNGTWCCLASHSGMDQG